MTGAGREYERFGRFSLTGLMGAALQVILFDLCMKGFHLPGVAAAPIAVEMVVLHNFFWHEQFTWQDRRTIGLRERATRLWRFHVSICQRHAIYPLCYSKT